MRGFTYGDLPTTTGTPQPQPQMMCRNPRCEHKGNPYSAERGDYFWADPADIVRCGGCNVPMWLVRVRSVVEVLR